MNPWPKHEEEIFRKYAGKIPDEELAVMLNKTFSVIRSKRFRHKIKLEKKPFFSDEMLQFVRDNFRTMSNKEMADNLMVQFPNKTFTKFSVKAIMDNLKCVRTKEDIQFVKQHCVEIGVFKAAAARAAVTLTKHKPGTVFDYPYGNSNKLRQCVKVDDPDNPGKYKIILYETYVWMQHHHYEKHSGIITLIDPNKPITIDNLYLKKPDGQNLKNAAATLPDWFVAQTITRYESKEVKDFFLNNPQFLEPQRKNLQLKRLLKEKENAGESENNQVAGTPAKDAG